MANYHYIRCRACRQKRRAIFMPANGGQLEICSKGHERMVPLPAPAPAPPEQAPLGALYGPQVADVLRQVYQPALVDNLNNANNALWNRMIGW
jgi:hypothetical protein